ncbi:MAG: carboxypeptidase-like regulatory domain-containing protein [Bacteroidales bacterium]|nr:carboxypeptidase-like regulatory domain-containing protein [Bacteroidales bacterium]
MRILLKYKPLLLLLLLLAPVVAEAQGTVTAVQGRVRDAETNEPIPFVQIVFEGTTIGTETDMDGKFSISNTQGLTKLQFRMMGYEAQTFKAVQGKTKKRVTVKMVPRGKTLQAVEITAKKGGSRYSRKHNPAVELVKKVIAHKEENRLEHVDQYHRQVYERLSMSLDDFNPDFEGKRIWRKLNFLEKYIDETEFDATPILCVSMREALAEESYRKDPSLKRRLVKGKRMEGLDEVMEDEGMDANIQAMFTPVDIYDGDIELMLNHFTSPLSPVLAVTFYKYYITDTTFVDGQKCVELSFVPANQQSYGFTGRMYVSLDPDSTFALTKYVMTVSPHVNLNFVRDLSIVQTFHRDSVGHYLPYRCDTYGRMYISKRIQELYVHQMRVYTEYDLSDTADMLADSLFSVFEHEVVLPRKDLLRYKSEFNARRPVKLTAKETVLDSMWIELRRLPEFRILKATGEVLASGYIPTHRKRSESRFDLGPVFNFLSYNHQEGWRVRLGGMSKATLSPRHFLEGYVAYGFRDQRPKTNLTYTYTFDDKDRHVHEAPYSSISLNATYELETPGQSYDNFDRDNIFSSSDKELNVQYVAQALLRFRKEWKSHLRFDTWLAARRYEPAGSLEYLQYQADGSLKRVDYFTEGEFHVGLSFTPNFAAGTRRRETQSNLRRDAPTISLSHNVNLVDGETLIQSTSFSADKRFWLSSFGHIDAKVVSGVIWNRAPYTRLYIPSGNANLFLATNAFNTMRPMEFIMDQYVAFFATYHLKGWILNRIPLINRLRLREVVGFNFLYGGLSNKNDFYSDPTGLYKMPEGTQAFGTTPYMEYSIGVENILKFLRVDFVRRLSYLDGLEGWDRWFVRIDLKFQL